MGRHGNPTGGEGIAVVKRALLLKLRNLLDEIEKDSSMSALEVMWQIRTHTCNQAEIPQAIFRVGDHLASVVYLEETCCWEVQLNCDEHQFDTFEEALGFIEQRRRQLIQHYDDAPPVGQDGN